MNKEFNLEEAEKFIDNIYQHKFDDMEEILEDGTQVVHLGGLDDIKFTDFESASFTLLRGEQRLKHQVKKQKEIINKIEEKIKENIVNAKYEITRLTITDREYYKYINDMLNDLLQILEDKEVSE